MLNYCTIPCCVSNNPEQIALALTGFANEMSVSWVTALNATAASPCVSYIAADASGGAWQQACGAVSTYTDGGWLGSINHVVLTQLTPRATYNYTGSFVRAAGGALWRR